MHLLHSEAREALQYWGMENEMITDLYYESSGNKAINAVCVGEKHILKRFRDLSAVNASLKLAREVKEAGMNTQTPLENCNGLPYVQIGAWFYSLYQRFEGKELAAADLYGASGAAKARFVGELIGQMHLALRKAQIEVGQADLLSSVRDWALPRVKESLRLTDCFCQGYLETFERLYPALPRQIIHRDPNPGNILMAEDGWGVIGFEMAECNARLYDPCYAATAVLSESFDVADVEKLHVWIGICQNILLGYDSIVPLTAVEKEAIPYMILANQFVCVAWFATQPQYAEVYEANRKMTLWLLQHFQKLNIP